MIRLVQTFNGEPTRVVGRARTSNGVARLLRSIQGAGEGWGARVVGSAEALRRAGAVELAAADGVFDFAVPATSRRPEIRVSCNVVSE